jgi:hypothetical protein
MPHSRRRYLVLTFLQVLDERVGSERRLLCLEVVLMRWCKHDCATALDHFLDSVLNE